MKNKTVWLVLFIVLALPVGFLALNKGGPLWFNLWGEQNLTHGVAVAGYDVVAYHATGEAQQGDQGQVYRWNNANWYFSNEENRSLFEQDPARYAPEYGGYCATAVSVDMTFDIDPEIWHIEDGRLFLFFNQDAKQDFVSKLEEGIMQKADANWMEKPDT